MHPMKQNFFRVIIQYYIPLYSMRSSRRPREIDFRLLRSVGAKNYGSVSSDARKEAGEKILPQGVYYCAHPVGERNTYPDVSGRKDVSARCLRARLSVR